MSVETAVILRPALAFDPRDLIDAQSLSLASRNAYPLVAARLPRGGIGMVAGVAIALALGGATFWTMSNSRDTTAAVPRAEVRVADNVDDEASEAAALPVPSRAGGTEPGASLAFPAPSRPLEPAQTLPIRAVPEPSTFEHASSSTVVFEDGTRSDPPPPPAVGARSGASARPEDGDALFREGGSSDAAVASAMANPTSTVTQGTLIPAILETAIDTDIPGFVRAVVSQDVKSFSGGRIVIPRSSRLIGQYKSGLAAGQKRVYIIWTRLIRPDGASVTIASPAVEFSGQAGLAGEVDSHFLKRFGSAMLLSIVGGLGNIGMSGGSLLVSGGQSAASVAASRDAQIPPTVRIRQGQPIRVFTARDLDFGAVS